MRPHPDIRITLSVRFAAAVNHSHKMGKRFNLKDRVCEVLLVKSTALPRWRRGGSVPTISKLQSPRMKECIRMMIAHHKELGRKPGSPDYADHMRMIEVYRKLQRNITNGTADYDRHVLEIPSEQM